MRSFVFENSTKVYFGEGCVPRYLPEILESYGPVVMLVYGGGSIKKNGVYDEVIGILKQAGKRIVEFSGVMVNPTYKKVLEGTDLAKRENVDLILGVGGGSVMDCSKAISMAARCEGDAWERFWANRGIVDFTPVPLGFVVTLPGTGSEVNGGAVVTNEAVHVKTDRDYPECNAAFSLMDPTYTYSLPERQMAASGFDILSHIMEIYFSEPDEDNVSDDISEALMRNLIRNLRVAMKNPRDYIARSNIMWDASMAENRIIKLNKKTDFECHQIEHQLSAYTNCSHGEGLAVLHPVYYRHICCDGLVKFGRFAVNVWGISPEGKTPEELAYAGVDALADFIRELKLPVTLKELGIPEDTNLEEIAGSCNISEGSYRPMTHEEILKIFLECRS